LRLKQLKRSKSEKKPGQTTHKNHACAEGEERAGVKAARQHEPANFELIFFKP
jgi:hypothetical protein